MRVIVFLVLWSVSSWAAAAVGAITDVHGEVRLQRGDALFAAAAGVDVEEDDLIETGANAGVQIEMGDGSLFKLGPQSRVLLSDYKLDTDRGVLDAGIDVLSGWLRFAVGKLRRADRRYEFNTPTMTIGVRGTEGVIEAVPEHSSLLLEEGEVVTRGQDAGSVPIRAGEFIERRRAQPFHRPGAVPPAFRQRMPGLVQARLARRAQLLQQRGVPPRQIRKILREDRQRYLQQHPHLRHKLEQRFRERAQHPDQLRNKEPERRQHPQPNRERRHQQP